MSLDISYTVLNGEMYDLKVQINNLIRKEMTKTIEKIQEVRNAPITNLSDLQKAQRSLELLEKHLQKLEDIKIIGL